jgi:ribosomal protein S18 acetylase RimI-like enzyme
MTDTLPNYVLLPADLHDLSQLRMIEKVCFLEDAWPLIELIAVLMLPGLVKVKAQVGTTMVGFVGGDAHRSQWIGWITTLGVLPEYRRLGIATALLRACEKAMRMPIVRLSVRKSNRSAQHLYFERGFQQVETWERYYEGGEDALVLEKKIILAKDS